MADRKNELFEQIENHFREIAKAASDLKELGVSEEECEKRLGRYLEDLEGVFEDD